MNMNMARLTAADMPLFNGITSDLFPGVEVPDLDYGKVCMCVYVCAPNFLLRFGNKNI